MKTSRAGSSAILVLALALGGCASSGGGGTMGGSTGLGDYNFSGGTLRAEIAESLDRTYSAAASAAEEARVIVQSRSKTETTATVTGVEGDGRSVKIMLQSVGPSQTQIKIHVGLLGNEGQSRLILDRMRYELAVAP